GAVTARTFAEQALSGEEEQEFHRMQVPVDLLRAGKNVLAVSVHQVGPASSDLVLDLEIFALTEEELPKKAVVRAEARQVINAYHKGHFVAPAMRIPDGYADGGTYMKIKEDGTVVATREVIMVDRKRDSKLAGYIDFARGKKDLPEVERAQILARYIDSMTSPNGQRDQAEAATRQLMDYRNSEILLGQVAEYCGGGVCRHRSLLFKIMGDEAGLKVGLRRGHMKSRGRLLGRHAWNEITLEDGSRRIVDVMNPEKNFKLPPAEKVSHKYAGIKGEELYGDKKNAIRRRK
ncbi:MAG: EDR1-related protein, partial [Verrucomicrobiota bacterium]|nr:EDR1-related protein [Verrucomicrobiota bacterium]